MERPELTPAIVQDAESGRVLMLATPRSVGHAFNPLSVFWCHRPDGGLECVVAEVHNTYGERRAYLLRPDPDGKAEHDKELHVSPFFDVTGRYQLQFAIGARGEVGMAGFGRHGLPSAFQPVEIRLTHSGAGRDHRSRSLMVEDAIL